MSSRSRDRRTRSPSRRSSRSPRGRSRSIERDIKGTVIRINTSSGYGFIDCDASGEEVFFHSNNIVDNIDIRQLREGDEVELDLVPSSKKPGRKDGVNVRPMNPDVRNRSEIGRRPRRRSRSYSRDRYDRRRRRSPSYGRGYRRRSYSRGRSRSYSARRRRRSSILCLDFKRGDCRYGDSCKFSHDDRSRRSRY